MKKLFMFFILAFVFNLTFCQREGVCESTNTSLCDEPPMLEQWQSCYLEEINKYSASNYSHFNYSLIYVDDNIPKLVIDTTNGIQLFAFSNSGALGEMRESSVLYIKHQNLLFGSSGRNRTYWDMVYTIQDSEFTVVDEGHYGWADKSTDSEEILEWYYYWNDVEVNEEEYGRLLEAAFDMSNATNAQENVVSYDEIIEIISNYNQTER